MNGQSELIPEISKFRWKVSVLLKLIRNFRSEYYFSDLFGFLWSLVFRPSGVYTSTRILWKCRGKVEAESLTLGIRSNRLGLIPYSRGIVDVAAGASFSAGRNVRIAHGCRIFVTGNLEIGDRTYLNPHSLLVVRKSVKIGSDCAISWNFQVMDSDFHQSSLSSEETRDVVIGNHVWIGANVTITKGVHIGNGSIIASGAVVNRDIPAGVLAGGVPAKVIREGVAWK